MGDGGEYDRALVVLARARQVAESLGDGEGVIEAMRQTGYVLHEQGKADEAAATYKDAMRARSSSGIGSRKASCSTTGARASARRTRCRCFSRRSRSPRSRRTGSRWRRRSTSRTSSTGSARPRRRSRCISDVIAQAKKLGDDENLATAEMNESDSLVKLDRYREAVPLIDAALASYKERGDENGVGYALASRGDIKQSLADIGRRARRLRGIDGTAHEARRGAQPRELAAAARPARRRRRPSRRGRNADARVARAAPQGERRQRSRRGSAHARARAGAPRQARQGDRVDRRDRAAREARRRVARGERDRIRARAR